MEEHVVSLDVLCGLDSAEVDTRVEGFEECSGGDDGDGNGDGDGDGVPLVFVGLFEDSTFGGVELVLESDGEKFVDVTVVVLVEDREDGATDREGGALVVLTAKRIGTRTLSTIISVVSESRAKGATLI